MESYKELLENIIDEYNKTSDNQLELTKGTVRSALPIEAQSEQAKEDALYRHVMIICPDKMVLRAPIKDDNVEDAYKKLIQRICFKGITYELEHSSIKLITNVFH